MIVSRNPTSVPVEEASRRVAIPYEALARPLEKYGGATSRNYWPNRDWLTRDLRADTYKRVSAIIPDARARGA